MKLNKYSLALILGLSTLVSCSDRMDLLNPNQQTSSTFGFNADDLEECVIAAYNHIRMEGSYARVGYTIDVCRGDEAGTLHKCGICLLMTSMQKLPQTLRGGPGGNGTTPSTCATSPFPVAAKITANFPIK
mgnify:CR=1 FL=1